MVILQNRNVQRQLFRQSSSLIRTRIISSPICTIHSQGITNSVSLPRNQHSLPGPGTIRAIMVPVRQSISISLMQPKDRQLQILMTSFCFNSHRRIPKPLKARTVPQRTARILVITAYAGGWEFMSMAILNHAWKMSAKSGQ